MKTSWSKQELTGILSSRDPLLLDELLAAADRCRREIVGNGVYLRGLIEFSNECRRNCYYCGIRKGNRGIQRYRLASADIVALAMSAMNAGYSSLALQSGEVYDTLEINEVVDFVEEIKSQSQARDNTGRGLGITLSIGELSYDQYRALWEAGAHRYLLRIEASAPQLFKKIHPPDQNYEKRLQCLDALKSIGYQVGTGIMVGLPGQSIADLVHDLQFFVDRDIDMLGMGPYILHLNAPLSKLTVPDFDPFSMTLKIIALSRLMMPDINIVCSTALQTINPRGLELGLKAGANIVMPVLTPENNRGDYSLYADKNYTRPHDLIERIKGYGYEVSLGAWGDSKHYAARRKIGIDTTHCRKFAN